jgi:hypothetical protein
MRVFNALNGNEIKRVLMADFERVLNQDSEFQPHLTFPRVSWRITIEMDIYPRTPSTKVIEATGDVTEHALEAAQPAYVAEGLAGVRETLTSEERRVDAPDQVREEMNIPASSAPPQITFARRAEVGHGAEHPTIATGNRDRG